MSTEADRAMIAPEGYEEAQARTMFYKSRLKNGPHPQQQHQDVRQQEREENGFECAVQTVAATTAKKRKARKSKEIKTPAYIDDEADASDMDDDIIEPENDEDRQMIAPEGTPSVVSVSSESSAASSVEEEGEEEEVEAEADMGSGKGKGKESGVSGTATKGNIIGSGDIDMGEEAFAAGQTAPGSAIRGGGGAKGKANANPSSSNDPAPVNSSVPATTPRKRTKTSGGKDSERDREQAREEDKKRKLLGWKVEVLSLGLPEVRPRATRFVSDELYEDALVIVAVSRLGAGRQLPLSRLVAKELFLKSTLLPASSIAQVETFKPGEFRGEVLVAVRPTLSSAAGFRRLLKHKGVVYDASSSSCFFFSVFPLVRPLVRLELHARPFGMSFGQAKKALEGFKSPFPSSNFPIGEPPLFSRIEKFKAGDVTDAASATFMAAVNWDLLKGVPEGLVSTRAAESFRVAWAKGVVKRKARKSKARKSKEIKTPAYIDDEADASDLGEDHIEPENDEDRRMIAPEGTPSVVSVSSESSAASSVEEEGEEEEVDEEEEMGSDKGKGKESGVSGTATKTARPRPQETEEKGERRDVEMEDVEKKGKKSRTSSTATKTARLFSPSVPTSLVTPPKMVNTPNNTTKMSASKSGKKTGSNVL
ncbi:hypothetical protein B9479_007716, partial [Cryptococcus floricola]